MKLTVCLLYRVDTFVHALFYLTDQELSKAAVLVQATLCKQAA